MNVVHFLMLKTALQEDNIIVPFIWNQPVSRMSGKRVKEMKQSFSSRKSSVLLKNDLPCAVLLRIFASVSVSRFLL